MQRDKIKALFGEEWVDFMAPFVQSEDFKTILTALKAEKAEGKIIYPDQTVIFRAFQALPLSKVRVVVIGQDPYPVEGYANGLAFAHSMTKKIAPSLNMIIDAVEVDSYNGLKFDKETFNTELTHWVEQGVLLLNTALTVVDKTPDSHTEIWKPFTEYVIKTLSDTRRNLVFIAWGKKASVFIENIHFVKHFTYTHEHPSKAAQEKRPWLCKHFSLTNATITGNQLGETIKW